MEAPIPITQQEKIIHYQELNKMGDYYMKLSYTDKEALIILCYDIKNLDGICYEIKIQIQEIYNINDIFRQYNNIKDIFCLIIDLINEQKYKIEKKNENSLIFSFIVTDIKKIDKKVEFILKNKNNNDIKEYINILSNEIRVLRNNNEINNKEIKELKEEIKIIKDMIMKNNIKNNDNKYANIINKNVCSYCGSIDNLKKCICKKYFCQKCISNNNNIQCQKECFLLNNNLNTLTSYYHISKYILPKNFEAKIHFIKVKYIRVGITFDPNIINEKDYDNDSPKYNIYYKAQRSKTFYTYKMGWIQNYFQFDNGYKAGDDLIIKIKDGKLYYLCNGEPIGTYYQLNIDEIKNKNFYLLIHRRTNYSECKLEYIYELID